MKRALARIAMLFTLFVSLALAVQAVVKWWQGAAAMTPWDWFWLTLFAPLLYIYLRYFSILACKDNCTHPNDRH